MDFAAIAFFFGLHHETGAEASGGYEPLECTEDDGNVTAQKRANHGRE